MIWTVIGTLAVVTATIIAGMLADRRWSLLPRKEDLLLASGVRSLLPGATEGDSPATAVTATIGEIERIRRRQKCPRCQLALDSGPNESVTHDGVALCVLVFTCARCGGFRRVYVREVGA